MGRSFFLMIHFVVVDDYELPKSTWNASEFYLDPCFFFYFTFFLSP